jgi:hypothetical protein
MLFYYFFLMMNMEAIANIKPCESVGRETKRIEVNDDGRLPGLRSIMNDELDL